VHKHCYGHKTIISWPSTVTNLKHITKTTFHLPYFHIITVTLQKPSNAAKSSFIEPLSSKRFWQCRHKNNNLPFWFSKTA